MKGPPVSIILPIVLAYGDANGYFRSALLASGGVGAVGHGDLVLAGLLGVVGLLGGHGNATVLSGLDTNGLDCGLRLGNHIFGVVN